MKKYCTSAIILLLAATAYCQPAVDFNKTYIIVQSILLQPCDAVGGSPGGNTQQLATRGFEFVIDKDNGDKLVIHFLRWTNDAPNNARLYNTDTNAKEPLYYFILPLTEFAKTMEKLPKAPFAIGVAVIPIKLRFGGGGEGSADRRYFNFESAVSLGFSIGVNFKLDKSKFTSRNNLALLAGVSLSSVPLDSATTKGFVISSTNNASVTGHIGLLYQIDNFQIGLFSGIDYLSGKVGKAWVYRNKPWIGIGLGYSIFKAKKTTDTQ
jgi:hypothetical protein